MTEFKCYKCHKRFNVTEWMWKCDCGGMLDLVKEKVTFTPKSIQTNLPTMWRYYDVLPFTSVATTWKSITMGEGFTPLVQLDDDEPNTFVKVDYMMPTLSFKDRGAAVLIAKAKELGITKVIADSSGNAGTSIAAYARRAGISCTIFLSDSTSPKKIAQIKAHGATIRSIKGNREDVAAAAQQALKEEKIFYASHIYNPYFYEGTKTYAYEIWEQMQTMPDTLIIPVGNGTLLLGAFYGCKELMENGVIERIPKIVAVQAENCAPLAKAFFKNEKTAKPVENAGTLAEGIAIAKPARSAQILEAVRATGGEFITTFEEEITSARVALADKGFYVEPTTAANYAGYLKYKRMSDEVIVIPLCGAGIKTS
ncbi:threonine synthase [Fictibacillus phosphorivorans]|uniref:threonine synthase n=1 Tax=Fictibacillus phosphorivorans TaxID=1221500 RepID=UPI002041F4CD|nr:threonine synthase [Fictibacillus phosphorivorans]MCM3717668.1 threonine synthase [Fictibacillus phosphorivorans]MCM3775568.1 threonine synthase [Fictibacillus phosphorivorans]